MQFKSCHRHPVRQQGATLVIALLVLVLIMMIGITAVTTSNTQFKLAGNLQFEDSAMNNAEIAIGVAENWLSNGTNYAHSGFTTYNAAVAPEQQRPELFPIGRLAGLTAPNNSVLTMTWDDSNSQSISDDSQRYVIEMLSKGNRLMTSSQVVGGRGSFGCNQVNTYLITARGQSHRGASKFVQSYFSVLSC
jgi:Tfp pilus assembly protein PilX